MPKKVDKYIVSYLERRRDLTTPHDPAFFLIERYRSYIYFDSEENLKQAQSFFEELRRRFLIDVDSANLSKIIETISYKPAMA